MRPASIFCSCGRLQRFPFDFTRLGMPLGLALMLGGRSGLAQPNEDAPTSGTAPLTNTELTVQRTETAQQCPDAAALVGLVTAHAAPEARPPVLQRVDVVFSRVGGKYRVDLPMAGWREGHRTLTADEPTCQGLTQATVVAITILLDPRAAAADAEPAAVPEPQGIGDVPRDPSTGPVTAPAAKMATAKPTVATESKPMNPMGRPDNVAAEDSERARSREGDEATWWLASGLAVTSGFTEDASLALEAGGEVRGSALSLALLAFVTAPDTLPSGAGSVDVLLLGGHARPCWRFAGARDSSLALQGCLDLHAAAIRGKASGFEQVTPARYRPWGAVGQAVQVLGRLSDRFGWMGTLSWLFRVTPQETFTIDRAGAVYSTSDQALWVGFSMHGRVR